MASVKLGNKAEGSIIKLKENGVLVDFYVVKQNYESGLNGTGRVLVVRKDCYDERQWHSSDVNAYANSTIDTWLNGTYKNLLDANIRAAMGTTKFYYTPGNGNGNVTTLERSVFLLSATELGQTNTYINTEGTALSSTVVNLLKIAYLNGSVVQQWTRSPRTVSTRNACRLNTNGQLSDYYCSTTYGSRPAFTLPADLYINDDGTVSTNTAPTTPGSGPNVALGSKMVGSTVKLNVGGVAKEFLVVHQGLPSSIYDESCNGTWLLIEDGYENRGWNSGVNDYANSTIHAYLNSTILGLFDANIQAKIKQVKIPYRAGSGYGTTVTSGADGLSAKIILLSGTEVGLVGFVPTNEGEVLAYFQGCAGGGADSRRVVNVDGLATNWWLRSPCCNKNYGAERAANVGKDGSSNNSYCSINNAIRFALILPTELMVNGDGFVVTNAQPVTSPAITIPSQINGGSTITIEWGVSSDAEGNLEGYKVERSLDGGSTWIQIYQGGGLSTTNTVPFGAESVMYRVKAYDSEGLESGWKTSGQVTVINNTAPTVPGYITVPEQVQGGQPLAIAWGVSSDGENNLAGYSLERQVDSEGWAVVYSGNGLSFTDAITKGWQTVAYRVRAYDSHNAYSGFAVSETREVNNNTPPAITCEYPANTALGVKDAGFEIPYSVSDEEGDDVTVTETVDGAAWRTFAVELGEENSFTLAGVDFMRLLNGMHTLTITAADGASSATHSLSFEKLVTAASITLAQPMPADGLISVCVMSVSGSIPMDAAYTVEVTNNGLDDEPVWEDCTAAVKAGANHVFENETAENGFAFNFRLNVSRGESGLGGYITSVQGGFQ